MIERESVHFKIAWISLTIVGVAIFVFGLIVAIWPGSSNPSFLQAIGAASIGMGFFGVLITVFAYRRGERWAWFALWYYPICWASCLPARIISIRSCSSYYHSPAC
jgi:uncharacterized membrane protein HdeD (DUF308 family)